MNGFSSSFPPAPERATDDAGQPCCGRYAGLIADTGWSALALSPFARLSRRLRHKRWQYAGISHPRFFVGMAVVDAGWIASGFCYVFDRSSRRMVAACASDGLPGLHAHVADTPLGDAHYARGPVRLGFVRHPDRLELAVSANGLRLAAHLPTTSLPPVLSVVAVPQGGIAHATHKTGGLALSGFFDAGGERYSLDGAVASLDHSSGLLARHTRWRWASAFDGHLGLNLQQGYLGEAENALWMDGRLIPVGPVSIEHGADPLEPWRIRDGDGLVDLHFSPEGARHEDRNLVLASTRYVQPVGTFSGSLRAGPGGTVSVIRDLAGVTEDHDVRW